MERLREEISLVRLIESSGVSLRKRASEHIGRCPFHDDEGPVSGPLATAGSDP